eukprot:gene8471-13066_t
MAPGYTDIDADGRGEPEAGLTSFLSTGNVPGIICAFGTLLAFVGQLLQWTQSADEWCPSPTCSQKDANRFGTYNLFLFIISLANLHSFMRKKPQVLYISTALLFSVLEQNVGKANEIREQSMSSTLLASYILSFIGVFTTASEAWDVVTMTLASFIMIAVYVFKHDCLAIVAARSFSLMFHNGTGLRTGYIFVLFGSLCSFVGLPVVYSIDLAAYEAKTRSEEARPYIVSGFAIFCCVIFLWSEANYQGQLGFLALALIVFVGTNYTHGLHWVYVISLLLIADLTPFTTQQVGVYKVVILIVWITLLAVIYIHLSRFGSEAFQGGLFLFTAEHAASDADERA